MSSETKTRVFMSGRSQHVTIPKEFRFHTAVVSIRRDPASGEIILSEAPGLDEVFAALDEARFPKDFLLTEADRMRTPPEERPAFLPYDRESR